MAGTELSYSLIDINEIGGRKVVGKGVSESKPDYVLVFRNPNEMQEYLDLKIDEFGGISSLKTKFAQNFCISSDDKGILQEAYKQLEKLEVELIDVPCSEFSEIVIDSIFRIIQEHLGLNIKAYLSADKREIFVLIWASMNNLIVQADLKDYKIQVSELTAGTNSQEGLPFYQSVLPYAPVEKNLLESNQKVYSTFNLEGDPDPHGSIFKQVDRMHIIKSMLTDTFFLSELERNKILVKNFPLHNQKTLEVLQQTWASLKFIHKPQPFDMIKNYFGEEICIYFIYLNFLSKFFIFLSILGVIFFILTTSYTDKDYIGGCLMVYAIIQALTTTIINQFWIREENWIAWKWGVVNLVLSEEQRPEYKGELKTDEVTGKYKKIYKPKGLRKYILSMGFGIILFGAIIVIAGVIPIFILKQTFTWGAYIGGILNGIQIKLLNIVKHIQVYTWIATKMTDWENQETNQHYFNSLTLKIFCFEFFNNYSSLLYIALFKKNIEGCFEDNCITELRYQVLGIYFINFIYNMLEIQIPYIIGKKTLSTKRKRANSLSSKLNEIETEAELNKYVSPLHEYMGIIINYGFSLLFSTAFPLLSLFTLVMILVETRVDAWKLCFMTRRPFPMQSNSIGIWVQITLVLSVIGVFVNIAIVLFTQNAFNIDNGAERWIALMLIEHALGIIRVLVNEAIPDVPESVKKGVVWSERIVKEKVLHVRTEDEQKQMLGVLTKDAKKEVKGSEFVSD